MWIASGLVSETGIAERAVHSGVTRLAQSIIAAGGASLEVVLPDGSRIGFGLPARVKLVIRDPAMLAQLADATLASLAEAYVQGRIEVQGDLLEAIPLAEQIAAATGSSPAQRVARLLLKHSSRQDRAAIGYHYDVSNDFYRLWLDERMVYSCAYFKTGEESIDEAQRAKLDHICRKLQLSAGERFLDVGCGWGGLVLHAARHYGVRAVGITLSHNQFELARERVAADKLADRVEILLLDYRGLKTRFGSDAFDKVASVGMFEHVGLEHLRQYFASITGVLRDRGLFLNHGITSSDLYSRPIGSGVGDFVNKYVFPHGELPHLHVATREMARAGFEILDVESLRAHYAKTLQHWSRRLDAHLEPAARLVSDRTLRIWRAYLAGAAHGFAQGWMSIYQLLGSRQTRPGASDTPLTRDYMYR
ncbi:MAG: class I SAM-dependent methyltransferase [Pseudomonadota bacterium]|nr:class I SAM-dependent methyltransferase [Burkholderiaceae bacterium]MDQ3446771.1 class I SAM-dependent methyltransferase [Pseudomonadota bacterium]